MSKKMPVVQFRADEDDYRRAQERSNDIGVKFTDAMRAALRAVADGDVTQLSAIVCGAGGADNATGQEWLYRRCHELFEYRDDKLFRKYGSGRPGASGEGVSIRGKIAGEDCVLIHGKRYPMKDIVWLMHYGNIEGEVIYKNPSRVNGKHAIENLCVTPSKKEKIVIIKKLKGSEKIAICAGKLRAVLISAEGDFSVSEAIEQLINKGETISILLQSEDGWSKYRTGIHAFKIANEQYVVSIS